MQQVGKKQDLMITLMSEDRSAKSDPFKGNLPSEYERITPDKCSKWGKESDDHYAYTLTSEDQNAVR